MVGIIDVLIDEHFKLKGEVTRALNAGRAEGFLMGIAVGIAVTLALAAAVGVIVLRF
jgi:hypothetical protein